MVSAVVRYTQHAEARMMERNISKADVERVLAAPIRQVPALNGRTESQGWLERQGKSLLLRVITEGDLVVLVVTVMATSKFEKYGVVP